MNVLLVSGHPAQVHNFRLVREELLKHGHQVFWLTTKKDIATNLLEKYNIPYTLLQKADKGIISKIKAMFHNVLLSYRFIKNNHIDIAVSRTNPFVLPATWVLHIPHLLVSDTEHASAAPIMAHVFNKLGSCAVVPDCFWYKMHKVEIRFSGNIEMFYCRPGRYIPQSPYELLGISPKTRYAIVRFVKWDAYHDTKLIGGYTVEDKIRLVREIEKAGVRVFITSEDKLPAELEPNKIRIPIERMHDVMAHAEFLIGESSSMASECVVLGTPAIYVDQVGRGYTDEEAREGLLYMYRPVPSRENLTIDTYDTRDNSTHALGDTSHEPYWILGGRKESIEKAIELASPSFDRQAWKAKHDAWMATKFDCTAWLTWFIENYPASEQAWRTHRPEIEQRFR